MKEFRKRLSSLRAGEELPENRNWYWSEEDDALLGKLFFEPKGISEIAVKMGRSEASIVQRCQHKKYLKPQSRFRSKSPNGYRKKCRCSNCSCVDCKYCGADGRTAEPH